MACLVFHVLAVPSRTPASRLSRTSSTLPLIVIARASFARRRGPYKRKVDRDFLLQQLGAIRVLDGSFGFVESRVFDEDVTLHI